MDTTATYVKNNFGVIMKTVEFEDVVVRKNGRAVAKIIRYEEPNEDKAEGVRDSSAYYGAEDREISFQEYVALCNGSENRYELVFGKVYMLVSPKVTHQNVVLSIASELSYFFKGKKCKPFVAPFDITLEVDGVKNVVQPDIGVICDMDDFMDERDYYMGVPAMVIEVLSESTRSKDMVKKLNLYMLSGVREYWIVDVKGMSVYVYSFGDCEVTGIRNFRFGEVVESGFFDGLGVEF